MSILISLLITILVIALVLYLVRMLPVDERLPLELFAHLKDFPVATLADRPRIEAQHDVHAELVAAVLAKQHAHPPVRGEELLTAAGPALVVERTGDDAVLDEAPARSLR